ncbi:hypothetical protein [Nannocystis pusilla]|uniref:hypothetical protein n=1 Tax=Nannocystis pusilla TaxID=889268 RepID=UPI003B7CE12B
MLLFASLGVVAISLACVPPGATLQGLEALTEVGMPGGEPVQVTLYLLSELTSLDALAIDWHEAHSIWIYRSQVSSLDTFAGVPELDSLTLTEVDNLVDLSGLESLTVVHDSLALRDNASLVDLSALANLRSFGALDLERSALTDLLLPGLTAVGAVRIRENAELTALRASPASPRSPRWYSNITPRSQLCPTCPRSRASSATSRSAAMTRSRPSPTSPGSPRSAAISGS